jgi:glycosyltransferase involved in cell wall biosynthesis
MQSLLGFDRILAYGKWGEAVIRRTLGEQESEKRRLTSLPHAIDTAVFYPRDRNASRAFFFPITGAATLRGEKTLIQSEELLIGCVCTNQARKDIGLLMETVAILSRQRKVKLWLHTDVMERHYSIPALLMDFGLLDRVVISLGHIPDDAMAKAYSACDITIAPGPEGFGFPLLESQFCGTPVVSSSYAGGADIVPRVWQVDPVAFRYEGIWACKRPVSNAQDWANKISEIAVNRCSYPSEYGWDRLWAEQWEPWFRRSSSGL